MFCLPAYHEIPGVGLYLEQTLKYVNETFSGFRSIELTKSMISNYVKLGYLSRPVKKQYSRDQIAALLIIAVSKQVLSMDNIGTLFRMRENQLSAEQAYNTFREDFDFLLEVVWNPETPSGKIPSPGPSGAAAKRVRREDGAQNGETDTSSGIRALLWQVASADAYSIYLNELFGRLAEDVSSGGSSGKTDESSTGVSRNTEVPGEKNAPGR